MPSSPSDPESLKQAEVFEYTVRARAGNHRSIYSVVNGDSIPSSLHVDGTPYVVVAGARNTFSITDFDGNVYQDLNALLLENFRYRSIDQKLMFDIGQLLRQHFEQNTE